MPKVLIFVLLILWIIGLVVCWGVAEAAREKGYSFAGFFWFAFFFLPFAITTVILAPDRYRTAPALPGVQPEGTWEPRGTQPAPLIRLKTCRHCGEDIPAEHLLTHIQVEHKDSAL